MEYDCQACGACCSHKASWPVLRRDRSDARDIPLDMLRSDLPLMRCIGTRCIALEGEVGMKTSCSIYGMRPMACQKFVAGSKLCLEARAAAGI